MGILGDNIFNGDLKPGRIIHNSIDLGLSVDEILVENEIDFTDIFAAQYGTKPIDKVKTGELWMVTVNLTKYTIAQLEAAMNGMTVSAGGSAAKKEMNGYLSMYDNSSLLILKRTDDMNVISADEDYWINFPRAYWFNEADILTFGPSEQETFEAKFVCFRDRTSGSASLGNFWWSGQASTALA